jgi:3-dehydroquinate synthase
MKNTFSDGQGAGAAPGQSPDEAIAVYNQQFSVSFDYPVVFARDVLEPRSDVLADTLDRRGEKRRHRAMVCIDAGLADAQRDLARRVGEYFHARPTQIELAGPPLIVPGGEAAKQNFDAVRDVMFSAGNAHLDRQSFVIAIGGGSMLDMVGLAASLVHRGLRLVRMPSTVLAQNDAGIGVKNGMDEHGQKNFLGTFAPPFAVINDFSLLATLADRDWVGGIAEAFKVAIIKDADFFDWLCENAAALAARNTEAMEQLIRRCAVLHLDHIATNGDPFEMGSARPLDFGHWAGHRLEMMTGFALGHGQAVAVGIALDSWYAMRNGLIDAGEFDRIVDALRAARLPVWDDALGRRNGDGMLEILDGLAQFREHLGGRLCVTLPKGIGTRVEVNQVNPDYVEEAVDALRRLSRRGTSQG